MTKLKLESRVMPKEKIQYHSDKKTMQNVAVLMGMQIYSSWCQKCHLGLQFMCLN